MPDTSNDFLEDGLRHGFLDADEELDLIAKAQAGDRDAMGELLKHNEKLIYNLAFRAFGTGVTGTSELVDLQQIGRMGFMHAVHKFKPEKGFKLTTYATWWVRQHIYRFGVSEGSTFTISHHDNEIRTRLVRCRHAMTARLGRDVSIEEVAAEVGVKKEVALNLLGMHYTSLDAGYDEPDVKDQRVQIKDPSQSTERGAEAAALIAQAQGVIKTMPSDWQTVMEMRYPLDGGAQLSYREIAERLNVSHQRVKEIEGQALKVLKHKVAWIRDEP